MMYRGYELTRVPYKPPYGAATTSSAVIGPDGRAHLVSNDETGQHVIDVNVRAGIWPDREGGASNAVSVAEGDQARE